MQNNTEKYNLPLTYVPYPHQQDAWKRRLSGKYAVYVKCWCRQGGKDTDDIQYELYQSWINSGTRSVYVGLDKTWTRNIVFDSLINGHTHFAEYPNDLLTYTKSPMEATFHNGTEEPLKSNSTIFFTGMKEDEQLIGSAFDRYTFSESSLYKRNPVEYLQQIWDRKIAIGAKFSVSFNGTPRGIRNHYFQNIQTFTNDFNSQKFSGEYDNPTYGKVYIDLKTATDLFYIDSNNEKVRLYSDEYLERLSDRYMRKYGNLNLYRQEMFCEFQTVNAGLVYQAIASLLDEGRFTEYNINTRYPLYAAWDISSKNKSTDATAVIIFQHYNGKTFIYDCNQWRGLSFVDCISEVAKEDYFQYIRASFIPWDADRSASSLTPQEEAQIQYPNITWHRLDQTLVERGINNVRELLPNMIVNATKCDRLIDAFSNYEYKFYNSLDDWSPKPVHNWASHLMDALRYGANGLKEFDYYNIKADGTSGLPKNPIKYGKQVKIQYKRTI
jgi:hypothetical protein